jgi:alpha-beta hydrolase superfamily lysophospholipase
LQKISEYVTADVSSQVTSDVLLMAGQDDTYVPYEQFFEQVQTLTNARSISTRTFTRHENNAASGHLNCGNGVAAVTVVLDWLDQTLLLNPDV